MNKRIDLSGYRRRSDRVSAAVVCGHLALVLIPLVVAARLGPSLLWLPLGLWFGMTMNGLLNLLHECAHGLVFRRRGVDRWLGAHVLAPLAGADFDGYRARHFAHHRCLGEAADPKYTYRMGIHGRALLVLVGRSLLLTEARQRFRQQSRPGQPLPLAALGRLAVFQGALLALLTAAAALGTGRGLWGVAVAVGGTYGLVYGYGLAAVTVLMSSLRAIAEHRILDAQHERHHGAAALRNFRSGWMERLFFGAYGFAEHATHHLEPALPCYHLRDATRQMALEDESLLPGPGYLATLRRLWRHPDALVYGAQAVAREAAQVGDHTAEQRR